MSLGNVGSLYVPGSAANATRRQCACGDWITVIADDHGVMLGVRSHRSLPGHRAWLAQQITAGVFAGDALFPRQRLPLTVERARFGPEPTAGSSRSLVDVSEGITAGSSAPSRNGALE